MNPKIFIVGAIVALIVGIVFVVSLGPSILDEMPGNSVISGQQNDALPLEIILEDITVLEITERAAFIEVEFTVTNPNQKSIILNLINYQLIENDINVARSEIGNRPEGMVMGSNYFTLLSGSSTKITDEITIKNTGNTPELWESLSEGSPKWKIIGEAFFNLSSMTSGGENQISFEFTK